MMEFKRRFMFHGDAVAVGGRIVDPVDMVLDPRCASALPVTGGRTSATIKGKTFGRWVSFGSASTWAEGFLESRSQALRVSRGLLERERASTVTNVRAEVNRIVVGTKPRLLVQRLVAALGAKSAPVGSETCVKVHSSSSIKGVSIDGHRLEIALSATLFQRCDTSAKLLAETAAPSPKAAKVHQRHLIGRSARGPETVDSGDYFCMHGTIVKSIRWVGEPYPGAEIDGHVITVPDFGKIFFGEVVVCKMSRRLTMLRLEWGSPFRGDGAFGDVQDNGTWS